MLELFRDIILKSQNIEEVKVWVNQKLEQQKTEILNNFL